MIRSLSVLSAGVVALAIAGGAKADGDLVRLDGKGDADFLEARYGGGGFRGGFGGGYRGGFGGYRGGFGYGGYSGVGFGYGGYRGFGYGGYRGYGYGGYRSAFYRPYYGGFGYGLGLGLGLGYGYGGYGYGGGYGGGYYGVGYGGYSGYSTPYYSSYYSPCASAAVVGPQTLIISQPPAATSDGTFPYDGGPSNGYVVPSINPAGVQYRGVLPRDGQLVSIPSESSGYRFLAFGEEPTEPASRPGANGSDTLRVSFTLPAEATPAPGFRLSAGSMEYPTIR